MTTQLVAIDPIRTIYLHIFLFLLSFITLAHARLLTIRISSQTESSQDCCVFIFLVTYDVIEYNLIMPPARRTLPFALAHSTSFAEGQHWSNLQLRFINFLFSVVLCFQDFLKSVVRNTNVFVTSVNHASYVYVSWLLHFRCPGHSSSRVTMCTLLSSLTYILI